MLYLLELSSNLSSIASSLLTGVDNVRLVLPDSYMDIPNKDYGGKFSNTKLLVTVKYVSCSLRKHVHYSL